MRLDPSGNLGIGTFSPFAAVEVVREEGTPLEVFLTRYGGSSSSGEPNLLLRTARGTAAAPTAVQADDELGGFSATGYGATGFGEFGAGMGRVRGGKLDRHRARHQPGFRYHAAGFKPRLKSP